MTYRVFKNFHYSFPPHFWLLKDAKELNWLVEFDASARYDLKDANTQLEINKLCGIGYFPSHHIDSARFGWRYNIAKDKIELLAYCYIDKVRNVAGNEVSLGFYDINHELKLNLGITDGEYIFKIDGEVKATLKKNHKKSWGYRLGLYFGGTKPAPHGIGVYIKCI